MNYRAEGGAGSVQKGQSAKHVHRIPSYTTNTDLARSFTMAGLASDDASVVNAIAATQVSRQLTQYFSELPACRARHTKLN